MRTTIGELTAEIRAFRDARDWRQFHNPKELAVAITAEAGELLQHFVWQNPQQSERRVAERRADIESEIADVAARRLYIPRGGRRAVPATDTTPAAPAVLGRITVFDLDTLEPLGEIPETGGNGVVVDPKSGHGFSSSKPVTMFDTKTLKLIKTIDVGAAQPDGLLFDAFNDRVYIFSHPTKDATVIDSKDGTVLGTIDLGGVPEQGVVDGKGNLWVVMQDALGSVTAVDVKTMKAFSSHSNGTMTIVKEKSPTSFEVERNLQTMMGARTLTLDRKTDHILTMSVERGPAPPPPPSGGRGGQGPAIPGSFSILVIGK